MPYFNVPAKGWLLFLLMAATLLLSACTRHSSLVTRDSSLITRDSSLVIRDTLRLFSVKEIFREAETRDSVFRNSETRGDTVFLTVERWRTATRTVLRVDTVFRDRAVMKEAKRDSILVTRDSSLVTKYAVPPIVRYTALAIIVGFILLGIKTVFIDKK